MNTNKRFLTPWTGILIALCALCLGFFAYLLIAAAFGLYCVSMWAYFLSASVGLALVFLLVCLWLRIRRPDWPRRQSVSVLLVALVIVTLTAGVGGGALMRLFQQSPQVYASPKGTNRLVVLQGGPLSEELRAYPMVGGFMYRQTEQDARPVSAPQVVVTWESETKATVSFRSLGTPTEVSEAAGTIAVSFR